MRIFMNVMGVSLLSTILRRFCCMLDVLWFYACKGMSRLMVIWFHVPEFFPLYVFIIQILFQ
jgi:hypothetical protein